MTQPTLEPPPPAPLAPTVCASRSIGAPLLKLGSWWVAILLAGCGSGDTAPSGKAAGAGEGVAPPTSSAGEASPGAVDEGSEPTNTEGVLDPSLPLSPGVGGVEASGPEAVRFVSDLCPAPDDQNGFGPIERDISNGEDAAGDGGPLSLDNVFYPKGLGTHAPSQASFSLGGACSRFDAMVGIDDEMKGAGSVRFQVWGDGQLLAQTDEVGGGDAAQAIDVDVSGVQQLRLVVDPGAGNGSDHADWADAKLQCRGVAERCAAALPTATQYPGYTLIWADEFDLDGEPNPANWSFENGFVRNEEDQWYQPSNAPVRAGFLVIEGRRERVPNPRYQAGSGDWKTSRQFAEYTSASLNSRNKQSFRFGRLEMRARFPAYGGLWPAWWMLGNDGEWPWNGEVDILEFYGSSLHANFVVGTNTQWEGNWNAVATPLSALGDGDWDARFHLYRMDWSDTTITLSVDGRTLNQLQVASLKNPDGQSPFVNPAYTLLNLAVGGQAGGDPSAVPFPVRYEVDYVRVYQREE